MSPRREYGATMGQLVGLHGPNRMLRIEFKNQPYDWFNLDDMGDIVRSEDFANTLRENIAHYFAIPYDCQAIFDEEGLLSAGADFSRSLQRNQPYFRVYDVREMTPDLREEALQKLAQIMEAAIKNRRMLTGYEDNGAAILDGRAGGTSVPQPPWSARVQDSSRTSSPPVAPGMALRDRLGAVCNDRGERGGLGDYGERPGRAPIPDPSCALRTEPLSNGVRGGPAAWEKLCSIRAEPMSNGLGGVVQRSYSSPGGGQSMPGARCNSQHEQGTSSPCAGVSPPPAAAPTGHLGGYSALASFGGCTTASRCTSSNDVSAPWLPAAPQADRLGCRLYHGQGQSAAAAQLGQSKAVQEPEPTCFEVALSKDTVVGSERRFGFANVPSQDQRSLLVTWIDMNGLLRAWNTANGNRAVQEGDAIISVNGVSGDAEAMRAQLSLDTVRMLLQPGTSRRPPSLGHTCT